MSELEVNCCNVQEEHTTPREEVVRNVLQIVENCTHNDSLHDETPNDA